ncbi:MAG: helix-turn-helix transcriptional regulator, partial [Clostridia bacterium]|nr:helix-turn-helix transcriptional regulator [Clostridia bacterium]
MPRDKTASHVKILAAARQEFLEQGFEKASMRRVGQRCGMTAAGVYRHCRDKADLFDQLVSPVVDELYGWLEGHVGRYMEAVEGDGAVLWQDTEIDLMREVVYPRMEDYRLLLTCAQGTRYEDFLHRLSAYNQAEMEK